MFFFSLLFILKQSAMPKIIKISENGNIKIEKADLVICKNVWSNIGFILLNSITGTDNIIVNATVIAITAKQIGPHLAKHFIPLFAK